jgi:hypothetical protein
MRRQSGFEISRDRLPAEDVVERDGIRCTNPLRTAFDLARRAPTLVDAVVALDTLLECGLVELEEVRSYIDVHHGWNGVPQARAAAQLAVRGVRSPPETRLRLLWEVTAGLPKLLVNPPVFDLHGRLLGFPDGLDPESATVLEFDGEDHEIPEQRASDRARDTLFVAHGLSVERVTKADMRPPTDRLIHRLAATRLRGLERPVEARLWTLIPSLGWISPAVE